MSEYKPPDKLMSVKQLDFDSLTKRIYHPSPPAWEDLVLYFLLLDRFSNGGENGGYRDTAGKPASKGGITLFNSAKDKNNAVMSAQDARAWWEAGNMWQGGTLKGLQDKIGYLRSLGITALWISPIFKQRRGSDSYHGYAIQDFLDVDPHFGTREDLRSLIDTAHENGIYIVLDVIMNHTGDVFEYAEDRSRPWAWGRRPDGSEYYDPVWDGTPYPVRGFRDASGAATIPFGHVDIAQQPGTWPDGAIWPSELQAADTFTRKGRISNWDYNPEFMEGDFFNLKDIFLGRDYGEAFVPSTALDTLCECLKFWIAYADIDGFRIDTVKHMEPGAVRWFSGVIDEFTQGIGKENFYLIGEITGGREYAFEKMQSVGIDAALGIDEVPAYLEYMVKGWEEPRKYFDLFRNIKELKHNTHTWFKSTVVTMFDDHDQVGASPKKRFCADEDAWRVVVNGVALNALTLGIPCIYYGTEQGFNGSGGDERAMRETMFGGTFGSFGSRDRHFFNENNWIYRAISDLLALRTREISLRRGRQYLRKISGDGRSFDFPARYEGRMNTVIAWSRMFQNQPEIICAINTDYWNWTETWVTIDAGTHSVGDRLKCLYAFQPPDPGSETPPKLDIAPVETVQLNGLSVRLRVPPAGIVIFK